MILTQLKYTLARTRKSGVDTYTWETILPWQQSLL